MELISSWNWSVPWYETRVAIFMAIGSIMLYFARVLRVWVDGGLQYGRVSSSQRIGGAGAMSLAVVPLLYLLWKSDTLKTDKRESCSCCLIKSMWRQGKCVLQKKVQVQSVEVVLCRTSLSAYISRTPSLCTVIFPGEPAEPLNSYVIEDSHGHSASMTLHDLPRLYQGQYHRFEMTLNLLV